MGRFQGRWKKSKDSKAINTVVNHARLEVETARMSDSPEAAIFARHQRKCWICLPRKSWKAAPRIKKTRICCHECSKMVDGILEVSRNGLASAAEARESAEKLALSHDTGATLLDVLKAYLRMLLDFLSSLW